MSGFSPARARLRRAVAAAVLLGATGSAANGRFPNGGYVVAAPGAAGDLLAVRATFGILTSRDGGRTWAWTCEDAIGSSGVFEASLAIAFDGAVLATTPRGLIATHDGCAWSVPIGSPGRPVVDISQDATRRVLVTAVGPSGADDALLRSMDGGATWMAGAALPGLYTQTVEVAPSDPRRIYASGFLVDGTPLLYRSDDGGSTVVEVARGAAFMGGTNAFISGVDPTDPGVLYVRSADGLGTMLLRSADGGASFRQVARTAGEMAGFAISDDGSTLWIGSRRPSEGILRSEHGGAFVPTGARLSVQCLRQFAGTLYVCADPATDGFMLGCSRDRGDHVAPLLAPRSLTGPPSDCAPSTPVATLCAPLWPAQRAILQSLDGGLPVALDSACFPFDSAFDDAAVDVPLRLDQPSVDAPARLDAVGSDGPVADAGSARDAGPSPPSHPGCQCRAGASSRPQLGALVLFALIWFRRGRHSRVL